MCSQVLVVVLSAAAQPSFPSIMGEAREVLGPEIEDSSPYPPTVSHLDLAFFTPFLVTGQHWLGCPEA